MSEDLEPIAKSKILISIIIKLKAVKAEIGRDKKFRLRCQILQNAIKYNNDGGNVEVTVDADNQNAFVTIADDGVGIAEEELGKIFDRFYRVDKTGIEKAEEQVWDFQLPVRLYLCITER